MKVKQNKVNIIEELAMIEYTKKSNLSDTPPSNPQISNPELDWFKILNLEDNSPKEKDV